MDYLKFTTPTLLDLYLSLHSERMNISSKLLTYTSKLLRDSLW